MIRQTDIKHTPNIHKSESEPILAKFSLILSAEHSNFDLLIDTFLNTIISYGQDCPFLNIPGNPFENSADYSDTDTTFRSCDWSVAIVAAISLVEIAGPSGSKHLLLSLQNKGASKPQYPEALVDIHSEMETGFTEFHACHL